MDYLNAQVSEMGQTLYLDFVSELDQIISVCYQHVDN